MARLVRLSAEMGGASMRLPGRTIGVHALAGADYPPDVALLQRAIRGRAWPRGRRRQRLHRRALGRDRRPWGIALICGEGINGAAIAPDGRQVRFDGVGDISGDWGGGLRRDGGSGRGGPRGDGRGPRTCSALVPAHFGLRRPRALTRALYDGRVAARAPGELSPVVFAAAATGDAVARSIVDRLADELVVMAVA